MRRERKMKKTKYMAKGGKNTKYMAKGGPLKDVPEDNKGLGKLPKKVRNQMGFKAMGGKNTKMKAKGMAKGGKNTKMKAKGMARGGKNSKMKPMMYGGMASQSMMKKPNQMMSGMGMGMQGSTARPPNMMAKGGKNTKYMAMGGKNTKMKAYAMGGGIRKARM